MFRATGNEANAKGQLMEKTRTEAILKEELDGSQATVRNLEVELEKMRGQVAACSEQMLREQAARKEAEEEASDLARAHAACDIKVAEMEALCDR